MILLKVTITLALLSTVLSMRIPADDMYRNRTIVIVLAAHCNVGLI